MSITARELAFLAADARLRLEKLALPEPAVKICITALRRMEQLLARPPRVAIMGEVNSGKTSVADLLLGSSVLPASVVSNTHVPISISYSESLTLDAVTQQGRQRLTDAQTDGLPAGHQLKRIEIGLPEERLQTFEILDTPSGYQPNANQRDAQIFIWCTVASRAWTESERARWSAMPRRCWSNALLVITHKDAIAGADDLAKIEQRVRRSTAGMFRDVIAVSADGSRPSVITGHEEPDADDGAGALLGHVSALADEHSARRARKAERIIRHLARLTFHHLAPGPLSYPAAAILKSWESDSAELLHGIDGTPEGIALGVQALLERFAHSLSEARAGRIVTRPPLASPGRKPPAQGPYRVAAARRYVRLIAADLTALLRIDLAQWGLRDAQRITDYAEARAALLPLANLDATFDELGRKFAGERTAAAS